MSTTSSWAPISADVGLQMEPKGISRWERSLSRTAAAPGALGGIGGMASGVSADGKSLAGKAAPVAGAARNFRAAIARELGLASELIDQSLRVVTEYGARAIIFSSTGMAGLAKGLEEGLRTEGIANVPVINPLTIAWEIAEALADMWLSYHRGTYLAAPEKGIVGY